MRFEGRDAGVYAAKVTHFLFVPGSKQTPASVGDLRIAICDLYKVTKKVGFEGNLYVVKCGSNGEPVLPPSK